MASERSGWSATPGAARAGYRKPVSWQAKAGYAALSLVLALTTVQCVRLGMAGLFAQTALSEVERWTGAPRKPGPADIRYAAHYFSESLAYIPDNPWSLEGLGAMELARMRASRIPREALAVTRSAHARFRQALQQRPTSPFLWANLALTKLYLDEIDDELRTALRHADELGPWEPAVQQTVLLVGLAAWPALDPGLRQTLARSVERGAVRNAQKMFDIAKSYNRFDLVCDIEKYRLIAGTACANAIRAPGRAGR